MTSAPVEFASLIKWLNDHYWDIYYFIPWGYEGLPQRHSGGDVDIWVHQEHYDKLRTELIRRGYQSTKCPRFSEQHLHEYFVAEDRYTLDVFSSFCFSYQDNTTVLTVHPDFFFAIRTFKNGMYVSSELAEAFLTALRVLGGRTDCVPRLEKYLDKGEKT